MNVTRAFIITVELQHKLSAINAELTHYRLKKAMGPKVGVDVTATSLKTVIHFTMIQDHTDAEMRRIVQSVTQGLT